MSEVVHITTPEGLRVHLEPWRAACAKGAGSLYLTPEWILSLWESHYLLRGVDFYFCGPAASPTGIFPFVRHDSAKFGIRFKSIELLSNSYGQNHNELVTFPQGDKAAVGQFMDLVGERPWDIISITSIPTDSPCLIALKEHCASKGLSSYEEPGVSSPYLPLPETWDAYLASRSSNFRNDMRRKWTKASGAGVKVRECRNARDVEAALADILQIEERSWKQRTGTSIPVQDLAVRFYRSFLPKAAERGWLRIFIADLNGQPIAYDMGILLEGRYYMLKTGFDESFGQLSPGVYIRQHVVRQLISEGVREHDFLGDADPYKLRWTSLSRAHVNLYICNKRRLRTRLFLMAKNARAWFARPAAAASSSEESPAEVN